ncbi:alpha-glucosidase [Allocoprobacillus halotolerans]|uniref:Alpha-glucosidase n=1 Tax=Allocoprobacillus halotolerans TaxID=2944914 RepID=A0ABY5I7A6_9FIRM|nr:alpha-glucosidase [Allocoprobacillus halotolerans]UTY40259.1 alpha-glucosidase [Allocoprobacillus halotolerans]
MQTWWKEEIVYQIYPKSFKDSNHDGIGDIQGIIEKLDYLETLGVTMLWVCPVYLSPMDDNGYDIANYYQIHPDFGTMEDMDELIQKAKEKNIKIIMDLVINHTSDEHAWFQEALKNPDSPYRQYYIFKEGVHHQPPTNWRSVFSGSVWEEVPDEENMYYFHSFSKKQPDLNWENPQMREDIYRMVNWWLEKGIAGFRVDAINFIKKDQSWQNGPVDGADGLSSCFEFTRNQPGIEVFFQELREKTFDVHQCMTVAEAVGVPYHQLDIFIGQKGCFSMMFDFNYSHIDITEHEEWFPIQNWTMQEYKDKLFLSQKEIFKTGWCGVFLENHDMQRSLNRLIREPKERTFQSAKALGQLFMFLKGTPFIYQGEEIGMINNHRLSIEDFDDLNSHAQYRRALQEGYNQEEALEFVNRRSRDNTRSPMSWNNQLYAGFGDVKPWLKNNEYYQEINVEKQENDPESVLSYYRQMIALRKNPLYQQTFVYGDFIPLDTEEYVIAYIRQDQHNKILCIHNLQNKTTSFSLENDSKILLSNDQVIINQQQIQLLPYQAIILQIV